MQSVEGILKKVMEWHKMAEQHTGIIKNGPNEGNLSAFCSALKEIQQARRELSGMNLDNCRVISESLSGLDDEGTDKLGALFGELLQSCSEPFELGMVTLAGFNPQPTDEKLVSKLALIASFLSESDKPSRLYVDVRGKYIILSIQPLLSAPTQDLLSYQRGTHPLIVALRALETVLVPIERDLCRKILPNNDALLEKALKPVSTIIVGHLNLIGKECLMMCDGVNHRFIEYMYLLDVLEELYLMLQKSPDIVNTFQACFQCLLEYCKQWFERLSLVIAQHSFGVPENSAIYEGTILAMNCLGRLGDYEIISEAVLNAMEDVKSSKSTNSTVSFLHPDSVIAVSFFVKQALTGVEENFVRASRLFTRPLKTNIFLLNNYSYMASMVAANDRLAALVPAGVEKNFEEKAKVVLSALEEAWTRLASTLKDTKSPPKDVYKVFTNELLEQFNVGGQIVIPDEDLRVKVRQLLQRTILPILQAFFNQHQALFVSSSTFRSARIDPDTVSEMISKMFEG